jgi:DNA-binding transcriptional LysR family regulator
MGFKRGHLRYFVAVAEAGQITRAAEKLHVAQPALSQAIANLESELGLQLLERHARGVTLTAAGEAFLPKARRVIATEEDAALTAQSLVRGTQGTIELGFLGAPPAVHTPELFDSLAAAHPNVAVTYHELQFPSCAPGPWLEGVDVALCHLPPADPRVWAQVLRSERRMVLAPRNHPLAARAELTVADVLDHTFIGFHPSIEPWWAGFWSLNDHRGGPPRHVTPDRISNTQELFTMIAIGSGILAVPACHADLITKALNSVVAIPLSDADPAVFVLVGREDRRTPSVDALIAVAKELAGQGAVTESSRVEAISGSRGI